MEDARAGRLHMHISDRSCSPPFRASLSLHPTLTRECEEERPAETVEQGRADRLVLTDLQETLKSLDESSESHWLTELLPLCSECQAFMNMGNQQGTKPKMSVHHYTGSRVASQKSPRFQIPRKRRRTAEGSCNLQKLKTPRAPPKARRLMELQVASSSVIEEWCLEEDGPIIGTSAARRRKIMGADRVEAGGSLLEDRTRRLSKEIKTPWGTKLPDSSSVNRRRTSCQGERVSTNAFPAVESDIDSSEYDNESFSVCVSQAEGEEKTSSRRSFEDAEEKAATQRVMDKIGEVEEIIRRVSLTSSEWMRHGSKQQADEALFVLDACVGARRLHTQPRRCRAEASCCRPGNQDQQHLPLHELRALSKAVSQSLHRVLSMEAAQARPDGGAASSAPSLPATNISPRASGSFAGTTPRLSPPLSSSLCLPGSGQHSPPPNQGALNEPDACEGPVTYGLFAWGAGTCGRTTADSTGTGSDKRNVTRATLSQTQPHRHRGEAEARQERELFSDEALNRQEEIWQQEVEESLSFCRLPSHPSRPRHIDFLRITAAEDDITDDTPECTPPPPEPRLSTPGEGEERTPGRLHAIWPPLKEEKVGLKYTEAEHQAVLLQLKRECDEELEKLKDDYAQELCRLRVENEDTVARLGSALAELQATLSHRRGDLRDVAVSTGDDGLHKAFRTVCIQTDRETFVRSPVDQEGAGSAAPLQHRVTPKKLDLSLGLAGQRDNEEVSSSSPAPTLPPPPPSPGALPPSEPPPATSSQTTLLTTDSVPPSAPPPPPPPSMSGFCAPPPPPPPPPPNGGSMLDKPPRKLAVEPSQPMKPLYWTRIQIQENNNISLWDVLEEPHIINTGEFEELFAKTTAKTKRKPLSESYETKAKSRKVVKLLDSKRSQAVGILISSLHLEMKDIQQAVLTLDHVVVDLEAIEALYDNRAQPDELERIRRHYETSEEEEVKLLDKPEQFLYELAQVPDFAGRARCIIFRSAFADGVASIRRKLGTVSSVCTALLEGNGVREVVGLVLALGNHMNGGSRTRGQADGFGLEILPKLKDVKSCDNRISLVDYVVSYYLHNLDQDAGTDRSRFPLPEPQDVFLAAQVKFEDLSRDLRQLGQDLTRCEKDVETVCFDSPEDHLQPFKDKMETFVLGARKEHADTSCQLMTVQKRFRDLVLYFGPKPRAGEKEVTPAQFFMLWFEFCADFKSRWKRENKSISKTRLKEAQLSVKRITGEKVETRKINPNSLKERLRQKQANTSPT